MVFHEYLLMVCRVMGLHSNFLPIMPDSHPMLMVRQVIGTIFSPKLVVDENDAWKAFPVGSHVMEILRESGYFHIQATKPDTVGEFVGNF